MLTTISKRAGALAACIGILAACSSAGTNGMLPQQRSVAATATHRTLADFLAAQGTYCVPPSTGVPPGAAVVNGCVLYIPPDPNFNGWGVAAPAPYCADFTVAAVDYAGVINQYLIANGHASLGTTISGSVTERARKDGTGDVTVQINTRNALAWAGCDHTQTLNFALATLLFGNKPNDVLAGAPAALANSDYRIEYTEAHVGDPFPDLIEINFGQGGFAYVTQQFHASASGELQSAFGVPSGTRGQLVVGQNGLFKSVGKAAADGFTAEFVHITQK